MGLNLAKNLNGLKINKKIGWARFGPKWLNGARKARRGKSGPRKKKKKKKKKTRLIIGLGPGRESWPVSRVWVCKNPARTWPVAIPNE